MLYTFDDFMQILAKQMNLISVYHLSLAMVSMALSRLPPLARPFPLMMIVAGQVQGCMRIWIEWMGANCIDNSNKPNNNHRWPVSVWRILMKGSHLFKFFFFSFSVQAQFSRSPLVVIWIFFNGETISMQGFDVNVKKNQILINAFQLLINLG